MALISARVTRHMECSALRRRGGSHLPYVSLSFGVPLPARNLRAVLSHPRALQVLPLATVPMSRLCPSSGTLRQQGKSEASGLVGPLLSPPYPQWDSQGSFPNTDLIPSLLLRQGSPERQSG